MSEIRLLKDYYLQYWNSYQTTKSASEKLDQAYEGSEVLYTKLKIVLRHCLGRSNPEDKPALVKIFTNVKEIRRRQKGREDGVFCSHRHGRQFDLTPSALQQEKERILSNLSCSFKSISTLYTYYGASVNERAAFNGKVFSEHVLLANCATLEVSQTERQPVERKKKNREKIRDQFEQMLLDPEAEHLIFTQSQEIRWHSAQFECDTKRLKSDLSSRCSESGPDKRDPLRKLRRGYVKLERFNQKWCAVIVEIERTRTSLIVPLIAPIGIRQGEVSKLMGYFIDDLSRN